MMESHSAGFTPTSSLALDEVSALLEVAVRHPRDAFVSDARIAREWHDLNYASEPNLALAIDEFEQFVGLIHSVGARIHYLGRDDGLTLDSIYVRDATVTSPRGLIGCAMGKRARAAEPRVARASLGNEGFLVQGQVSGDGRLEGGDLVWLDPGTVVVGRGYRTNDEGIHQLRGLMGPGIDVIPVHLPHWRGPEDVFHLMSMLSPIDHDLLLVYSPLLPVPFRQWLLDRAFTLLEVPHAEFDTMGCNVLTLAPRRCVMLEGNPETRRVLEAHGVEVMTYGGEEISVKGAGGPTCLTRPLRRAGHGERRAL